MLNQPELAGAAMERLRTEAGRPDNSTAGTFYLRLSTQTAINNLQQANGRNDAEGRREALSNLARINLSRFRDVSTDDPAYRVINETLNGTAERPSPWRSEVPSIMTGAADATSRVAPVATNALSTLFTTRDPALRQRAFESFANSARTGDDRFIQHLANAQDFFAFTQLRDNVNATPPNTNAVVSTLRLVEQADPNLRGNFLTSVNARMRADNPSLTEDPFSTIGEIINRVQFGRDTTANLRALQPALLAGLDNDFVTGFLRETRNLASVVSNPRDLVRVETPGGTVTSDNLFEILNRERESSARRFEDFGTIERDLLRPNSTAESRTEQIDALRRFLTATPDALRDQRLTTDFADLEAFNGLANLTDARTPAAMALALRNLTTLAHNGNEAARGYLDRITPAVSGGTQTGQQLLEALEGPAPASEAAMRELRGRLPSVLEERDRLTVNSAMRPLDLSGGPSATTVERSLATMRELAEQGNQNAVRSLPSLEVASLVQRLSPTTGDQPTQAQRLEIVDQITRLMNAGNPHARHALVSIIAGGAGPGHSTFLNQYFRPSLDSYALPPNLSRIPDADRQSLAARAVRDFSTHLMQNGSQPLSEREGGALALVAGSTTDATMRDTASEILARAIRSSNPNGALEGVFVAMAVEGTDRNRLGSLYLDNVQSVPIGQFNTFARWARNGDPTSINVMAAITSGLNGPPQAGERAQRVLTETVRATPSLQQPILEALLTRNQTSGDRGNLLATLGGVAANRQGQLPAELNNQVMSALRTGIEALPSIADPGQRARRQMELHDAWTANSRNWTEADGRLAARQFNPSMLESLSQRLDTLPPAAATALLSGLRERALAGASGSDEHRMYLIGLTRLARVAGPDDLGAVDRIRGAFNPAQLNSVPREQFQTALGSAYLSMISGGTEANLRNRAFDSFLRSGLSGSVGFGEAEIATLRSLASGTGPLDLNRLEQILTTRYGLGIQPPLPLVLRRMGIEGNHRAIASDLVQRLGGGERGETAAREAIAGFQLYSLLPADLRREIAPEGANFARYSTTPQAGTDNWASLTMDNRAFISALQSGQFSAEDMRAFGSVQARLGRMRNDLLSDAERPDSNGARLVALQQQRRQQASAIFNSATARDRDQLLNSGIAERNMSRRPLQLGDVEMQVSGLPTDSDYRADQTRAVNRLEAIDRQISELQREQTQFQNRIREIDSFLQVGTHQRMLMTANLAGADAVALSAWTRGVPGPAQEYFRRQLEVGTGAPGSTSALDRLFRHGMIPSAQLPRLDSIQSATDFIRSLPHPQDGAAFSTEHEQVNRALFNHAMERIIGNEDMQAATNAMRAFGNMDFANLVQAAALGRRTDELSALIRRDAESVRTAMAEMTPERVARLRDAMRHMARSAGYDEQGAALMRMSMQVTDFLNAVQPADPVRNIPEGAFRAMLRAVEEGHVNNPSAIERYGVEAARVAALAAAAAFTIATAGEGAIIALPLVSFLVSNGVSEIQNAVGLDSTNRGSTFGAWARGRGEFDADGNYRPMSFGSVAREAVTQIGMDYAMMGVLQGANWLGRAAMSQLQGPMLLNSSRIAALLTESQAAPVARNFFQRFAAELPRQLGSGFAFAGVSHAGDTVGMGEMGAGVLYEFTRGLFSRGVPPRSIRVEGDMAPMLRELNRRGMLHTEGQNYFLRLGNRNIPILRSEGAIPPGTEAINLPGNATGNGGSRRPGQRVFVEETADSPTTGRRITPEAQQQSRNYALHHEVTGAIHDGTVIGGAGRSVSADGSVVGGTAPLVINRAIDPALTNTIADARRRIASLPPAERVGELARFVAETFNPGGRRAELSPAEASVRDALYLDFVNQNGGRPMLMGEFIQNHIGGCREQAALFQLLATELRSELPAGTNTTMQRGNGLGTAEVINHAWNVVTVNGHEQIVDPTRGIFGRPASETGLTFTPGRNMALESRLGLPTGDLQIRPGERLPFLGSNGWRVESATADGAEVRIVHDAARVIQSGAVGAEVRTESGNSPRVGDRVELRLANGAYESGWIVRGTDEHGNLTVFKPDGIRMTVPRQQLLRSVGEMATHNDNTNRRPPLEQPTAELMREWFANDQRNIQMDATELTLLNQMVADGRLEYVQMDRAFLRSHSMISRENGPRQSSQNELPGTTTGFDPMRSRNPVFVVYDPETSQYHVINGNNRMMLFGSEQANAANLGVPVWLFNSPQAMQDLLGVDPRPWCGRPFRWD